MKRDPQRVSQFFFKFGSLKKEPPIFSLNFLIHDLKRWTEHKKTGISGKRSEIVVITADLGSKVMMSIFLLSYSGHLEQNLCRVFGEYPIVVILAYVRPFV